jgi:hypothetical protein
MFSITLLSTEETLDIISVVLASTIVSAYALEASIASFVFKVISSLTVTNSESTFFSKVFFASSTTESLFSTCSIVHLLLSVCCCKLVTLLDIEE